MTNRMSWRGRLWVETPAADWPEGAHYDQLRKRRDLARAIAELAVEEAEALTAKLTEEGKLTPAGIREKVGELAQGHIAKLKAVRDGLDRHHDALELLRERIAPVKMPDTSDPIAALTAQLKDSETRNWLLSLPREKRVEEIRRATKNGDDVVLRAVFSVPPVRIGVSDDFMEAMKSTLVRQRHGDTIEEVVQFDGAIMEAEKFYENAVGVVGDLAGLPDYAGRGSVIPGSGIIKPRPPSVKPTPKPQPVGA